MPTKEPFFFSHLFASICLAVGMFNLPVLAWGIDTPIVESNVTPALKVERNFALAKLQDFTSRASDLAVSAMSLLGINYKYGGTTPENGLDCSGFVRYVFKEAWGAILPRTSAEISRVGRHVSPQDLQPGDLVFYNTLKRGFSHVGIYLGDNKFIHSPSAGGQIRVESMDLGYWKARFNGARRLNEPEQKINAATLSAPTPIIY